MHNRAMIPAAPERRVRDGFPRRIWFSTQRQVDRLVFAPFVRAWQRTHPTIRIVHPEPVTAWHPVSLDDWPRSAGLTLLLAGRV